MQEIEIVFNEDGTVQIHGTGFKGSECQVMKKLAELLGQVESDELTDEFYQTHQNHKEQRLGW